MQQFFRPQTSRRVRPLKYGLPRLAALCLAVLLASCQPVIPTTPVTPDMDRVGFPDITQPEHTIFYEFDRPDNKSARVIYANEAAAAVEPGQPYPYGSVLTMAVYRTVRDDAGEVVLDENGRFTRDELFGLFVMRKARGFGEKYGDFRNGEWEYVAYRPDGSVFIPPERTNGCAACHMEAGQGKDWVFGTFRHFQAADATHPEPAENTVHLVDYSVMPNDLTVLAGTEISWVNNDVLIHTVTAPDLSFGSGALRPKATFTTKFEEAGTFDYFCAIHPSMKGTVVVTE